VFFALKVPGLLHVDPRYGALGLTGSAGVAGWIEFALLRRGIGARIGLCHLPRGLLPRLWAAAAAATAVGLGAKLALPPLHPIARAAVVLGLFGATYLGVTLALGVSEASAVTARLRRLWRR
jgi:putative peptidoglycan lipid II flippase